MTFRLRTVRYDSPAAQSIDEACERYARADDAALMLEWIIARDPTEGKAITESGMTRALTFPGATSIDQPTVTFVYVVDENYITVRSAKFEDAKPEEKTSIH